ncbi:MAG: V-type ATP synthase subunit A [bacterium]
MSGIIKKVSGPLIIASNIDGAKMFDVVKVSDKKLVGEIIKMKGDDCYIQVYEDTAGIGPGEQVITTGSPLSVELGPGLLKSFYDGVQRPLAEIEKQAGGPFITRGIEAPALSRSKKWGFKAVKKVGDKVKAGDIIGEVKETELIVFKVMVPPGVFGKISKIASNDYTVEEIVAEVEKEDKTKAQIKLMQIWPIRNPRPVNKKLVPKEPLITGQRIIDTLFPIVKGGTGCAPGPFGSGKTVVQHQLAKWADADIIVFIGCGERGNEMTDVLMEFPELVDPKSGEKLMERTLLIANTSNMPVAAREASVYTGITIAEFYRDMGYKVALMADSTSRWAEALREMSGRLEEMPGEEGYPAYLGSRTADFYERAGMVECLGSENRMGSLTVVGAVSPPGGDLSEPVTQNTLRVTKVFWGLDAKLAYRRHFPAINWLNSYSLYSESLDEYYKKEIAIDYPELQKETMAILQQESSLEEIVRLVGVDALSFKEQLVLQTAKNLREDFLHQNAFDDVDTYTSLKKQYYMLKAILTFHHEAEKALEREVKLEAIKGLSELSEEIVQSKLIGEKELDKFDALIEKIKDEVGFLAKN